MLTVSPTLTLSSLSTPAADDGISIEALSDSTVISDCSALIVSPGLTRSSMTATSLKSPMSGTRTSTGPEAAQVPQRRRRRWPLARAGQRQQPGPLRRGSRLQRRQRRRHFQRQHHRALLDLVAELDLAFP
jgi:hypothetical protein